MKSYKVILETAQVYLETDTVLIFIGNLNRGDTDMSALSLNKMKKLFTLQAEDFGAERGSHILLNGKQMRVPEIY